jgi:tetratricopeptide (TPR) repeat protein
VAEKALEVLNSTGMTDEQKIKAVSARADVFFLERKYREGLQAAESLRDDQLANFPGGLWSKYYYSGFARRALQDESAARAAFLKAKSAAEEQVKRSPDNAKLHVQLAKVLAQLGEKDAALAEAQRASELQPESRDALDGPHITEDVAQVHAILGDNGRAIEILDGLLNRPSYLTVQGLRVNPVWDPLRNDPRFQALLEKYAGKA